MKALSKTMIILRARIARVKAFLYAWKITRACKALKEIEYGLKIKGYSRQARHEFWSKVARQEDIGSYVAKCFGVKL